MSQFYSRYIPPTQSELIHPVKSTNASPVDLSSRQLPSKSTSKSTTKRKRDSKLVDQTTSKRRRLPLPRDDGPGGHTHLSREKHGKSNVREVLDKYSVSKEALENTKDVQVKGKRRATVEDSESRRVEATPGALKKRRTKAEEGVPSVIQLGTDHVSTETGLEANPKHAGVLSRFAKSKQREVEPQTNETDQGRGDATLDPPAELHGLEPLPQPRRTKQAPFIPSYSSLPTWLGQPTRINSETSASFSDLGLNSHTVETLSSHRLNNALPVQTAVIPMLLSDKKSYNGDICISAATGSGKTLAYVLPMIEDLGKYSTTRLRGLVVVPTRELVDQVRRTCEMFIRGTSVKVATAVGSKSLKDEAEVLIDAAEVYDPMEYQRQRSGEADWSQLSFHSLFDQKALLATQSIDYVRRFRSRVDLLICTPGRLVDHVLSTKGFSLNDVNWFVIDEADRLLNESYQEWIDVVMPELKSRNSTEARDDILRNMRLDLPPRRLRKVALSATMTRDISKLNSLDLRQPRLVVLEAAAMNGESEKEPENSEKNSKTDTGEQFALSETLSEAAIAVEDGSEKPLYLIALLRKHTNILASTAAKSTEALTESSSVGKPRLVSESDASSSSDDDSSDSSASASSTSDSSISSKPRLVKQRLTNENMENPQPAKMITEKETPASVDRALIFTRSTESAHRLSRLLKLLLPNHASEVETLTRTSTSSSSARKALASFRQAQPQNPTKSSVRILICTDRASRGLDIESLEHAISYDVPASVESYIHRVGRTARAGNKGHSWTLLAHREARWFWRNIGGKTGKSGKVDGQIGGVIKRGGDTEVRRVNDVVLDQMEGIRALRRKYEEALSTLREEVRGGQA